MEDDYEVPAKWIAKNQNCGCGDKALYDLFYDEAGEILAVCQLHFASLVSQGGVSAVRERPK